MCVAVSDLRIGVDLAAGIWTNVEIKPYDRNHWSIRYSVVRRASVMGISRAPQTFDKVTDSGIQRLMIWHPTSHDNQASATLALSRPLPHSPMHRVRDLLHRS